MYVNTSKTPLTYLGFVREIAQRFIDVNAQDSDTEMYELGGYTLKTQHVHYRLDLYLSRIIRYTFIVF